MSTLARYDVNTYKADMKQIPLIEGAKKYSDWQEHQDGADVFRTADPHDCDARVSHRGKGCHRRNVNRRPRRSMKNI